MISSLFYVICVYHSDQNYTTGEEGTPYSPDYIEQRLGAVVFLLYEGKAWGMFLYKVITRTKNVKNNTWTQPAGPHWREMSEAVSPYTW